MKAAFVLLDVNYHFKAVVSMHILLIQRKKQGPLGGWGGYRGGPNPRHVIREEGVFFKTSKCPRFVKEGYFFVPRYEVWGV